MAPRESRERLGRPGRMVEAEGTAGLPRTERRERGSTPRAARVGPGRSANRPVAPESTGRAWSAEGRPAWADRAGLAGADAAARTGPSRRLTPRLPGNRAATAPTDP